MSQTLAEELKAKYYDPDMETCDVEGIVREALERAAQECEGGNVRCVWGACHDWDAARIRTLAGDPPKEQETEGR